MLNFLDTSEDFQPRVNSQYTLIGYKLSSSGNFNTQGLTSVLIHLTYQATRLKLYQSLLIETQSESIKLLSSAV
mgnify:FL=1